MKRAINLALTPAKAFIPVAVVKDHPATTEPSDCPATASTGLLRVGLNVVSTIPAHVRRAI